MKSEPSYGILVAANDRCADAGTSFAIPNDVGAAVMVYAWSPRGSYFEFATHASSARLWKTPPLTVKPNKDVRASSSPLS